MTALKLNELEVDVSSTQIMMHEELSILRGIVDSGVNNVLKTPSSNNNNSDNPRVQTLETENLSLRSLLQEAQNQLASNKTSVANNTGNNSISNENKKIIDDLQAKVIHLETQLKDKDSKISAKDDELKILKASSSENATAKGLEIELLRSQKEVSTLKDQLTSMSKDFELKLQTKVKELTVLGDKRVEETQEKAEADKEEMMEALSQEVEAVEEQKKQEIDVLTVQIKSLESSLETTRGSKQKQVKVLLTVNQQLKNLMKAQRTVSNETKRELGDLQNTMNALFSGSLVRRLRVSFHFY